MVTPADEAPDMNAPPPPLQAPHPFEFYSPPPPLAVYRVVWDARGVRQINERLAEGWALIAVEFCEEVLARSPTTRVPTTTAYVPYAIIGKRESPIATDRAALADSAERAAQAAAIPMDAEAPTAPAEKVADPQSGVPMGSVRRPHRRTTAKAEQDGFQGTGGLAGRR